jgi:transcriptional regulator with XRE-family HTH domain
MDVGDRLREAREHLGMTQSELAAKLGVHVATVTL